MRAITIRQPMAHAVVHLGKLVENRVGLDRWRGLADETVAIHAGRTWDAEQADDVEDIVGHRIFEPDVTFGAIIGLARITDVHWSDDECCDPWGQHGTGIAHLVLDNVRPVPPVECRGALGAWRIPDVVLRELQAVAR